MPGQFGDPSYIPGKISIEYFYRDQKISFGDGRDFTAIEPPAQPPDAWQDAELSVNENSEEKKDITLSLPDGSSSIRVVSESKPIPEGLTISNAKSYGYTEVADDYGNTVCLRHYENSDTYCIDVVDWSQEILITQFFETSLETAPGVKEFLTAKDYVTVIMEGTDYELADMKYQNGISLSNMKGMIDLAGTTALRYALRGQNPDGETT